MMDGDEAALDEGARAALKAVEEESRAELETTLVQVGAVTSAELSRTEEMQARVDKIMCVSDLGRSCMRMPRYR